MNCGYSNMPISCDSSTTEEGEVLGRVERIESLPANDVMVVGDLLLPMIKDVIVKVDMERKRVVVRLLEGLR